MCDLAIERPSLVRPTLTHTMGMPVAAAWSAASISVRPSLKPSMYAATTPTSGWSSEVLGEVGELEVGLVARRRPVRQRDAELLGLEHGPTLVPALGDECDRRPRQIVAERLEGVEVGVRPEQMRAAASAIRSSSRCCSASPSGPTSVKPAAKITA